MAYSLKPTQKTCIARVVWFIKQKDAYNAREALKDVETEVTRKVLEEAIASIPY